MSYYVPNQGRVEFSTSQNSGDYLVELSKWKEWAVKSGKEDKKCAMNLKLWMPKKATTKEEEAVEKALRHLYWRMKDVIRKPKQDEENQLFKDKFEPTRQLQNWWMRHFKSLYNHL